MVDIVSLFSGYGGLEMGVQSVIGGQVIAHCEFDAAPSKILAHHWPDIPNLGDITKVNWTEFLTEHTELIDLCFDGYRPGLVVTGGFPCQDVSLAGLRRGLKDGTRSGLWSEFARAIDMLRPELVVIENVRGLLSAESARNLELDPWGLGDRGARSTLRALGAVLGDLADLGYDAEWCGVRAADVGAPHGRYRIFIIAHPADTHNDGWWREDAVRSSGCRAAATGRRADPAADADCFGLERDRPARDGLTGPANRRADPQWGDYGAAVERWERVLGRVAPAPSNPDGRSGSHRLAPEFVEWMMGLPAGHVTDAPITRAQQLKALGNGVVPQQAALAVRVLLERRAVDA